MLPFEGVRRVLGSGIQGCTLLMGIPRKFLSLEALKCLAWPCVVVAMVQSPQDENSGAITGTLYKDTPDEVAIAIDFPPGKHAARTRQATTNA